jgi:hypothetical protein
MEWTSHFVATISGSQELVSRSKATGICSQATAICSKATGIRSNAAIRHSQVKSIGSQAVRLVQTRRARQRQQRSRTYAQNF